MFGDDDIKIENDINDGDDHDDDSDDGDDEGDDCDVDKNSVDDDDDAHPSLAQFVQPRLTFCLVCLCCSAIEIGFE